ncbi:glutathione S-transferase family protein [Archangium primigenium]|uniref:glutathione S-transferase family protein n=1 Tax=[Archangium] primigenium TaxID=2792470 RepID=UPI0019562956|nr:glutathione S-transferase family protein [Archangium primigenium]MBM7112727.1 glutathione S-transferase family protein [Archangium primigenium]
MKLLGPSLSTAAHKVFAVVKELGLSVESVDVDVAQGEHKSPAFLAKNPNGKVPVLERDDGSCLWESNAIMCYLASLKPESGLVPQDAWAQAQMHQWLQWQATTFGPSTGEVMMETVYVRFIGRAKDEARYQAGLEKVRRDLGVLERSLAGREYLCGRLSLADFSLVSCLFARAPMGLSLEGFPLVQGWVERLEARESVRATVGQVHEASTRKAG